MAALLDEKNSKFFSDQFPIFYKNKIPKSGRLDKFYYRTAIDRALRSNQQRAVDEIIKYIVKFQNSYVSSFLFNQCLPILIEKGIKISHLLKSKVFTVEFDYDDWP